ncbi:hypothetical protein AB0J28_03880 [Streptosporangium canum]|uniref:hypothetical protein n=1 Tax=Streptosporangium canum TaxID=324952 RepID=UPI0034174ECC
MAVLVVTAAGSGYVAAKATASDPPPPKAIASDPLPPKVEGVEMRYLPNGLGQPDAVSVTTADLRGTALRWSDDSSGDGPLLEVAVYRSHKMSDALDILALNVMRSPVEPRKATDPVVSEDRTDMMWVPDGGLMIRLTTSEPGVISLETIARGLHIS